MTKEQIDAVLDRVHSWPSERQEDAVRILLAMEAETAGVYVTTEDERADIEAALDEVARGELASESEIASVFARYRA
jgi:predicted transcriptional regulator